MSSSKNTLKYSSYCVWLALATLSATHIQAASAPATSPYSTTPLHFKTTTSNSAKPNVMLLLDDSGSMNGPAAKEIGWPVIGNLLYISHGNGNKTGGVLYENTSSRDLSAQKTNCAKYGGTFFGGKEVSMYKKGVIKKYTLDNGLCFVKWENRKKIAADVEGNQGSWQEVSPYSDGVKTEKRTKMRLLKDTLINLLNDPESKNYWWGVEVLNNYGNYRNVAELTPSYKKDLITFIDGLKASGGTPTTQRYYEAVIHRQNSKGQVTKGLVDQIQYRCQPNHIILLSDGAANRALKINDIDTFFKRAKNYSVWSRCSANQCGYPYKREVIAPHNWNEGLAYLSRQFATKDLKSNNRTYHSIHASQVDKDGVSWDDKAFPPQTVTTHTIAFGEEVRTHAVMKAYLENGAIAGGGLYKEASDAQELFNAFGDILKAKVKPFKGYTSVAPAVINTDVAGIAATASLDSSDWSSQLQFFRLDSKGDVIQIKKEKDKEEPLVQEADFKPLSASSRTDRRVLLGKKDGISFFDGNDAGIDNAAVDIASVRNQGTEAEWAKTFIPWLARYNNMKDSSINKSAKDNSGNSNLRYRIRAKDDATSPRRHMGDILGSPVLALGKRKLIGSYVGANGVGVQDYKYEYLLTATNDGMVHIFTAQQPKKNQSVADKGFKPYTLKISYIPGDIERTSKNDTILKNLKWQMKPSYGKNNEKNAQNRHVYLLNGGIASRTTDANGTNRQTFIVGNVGQGGKGVYALNIGGSNRATGYAVGVDGAYHTPPASMPSLNAVSNTSTTPAGTLSGSVDKYKKALHLWMKSGDGLDYTISTPAIGRIATKWTPASLDANGKTNPDHANLDTGVRYAAFIANGYDGKSTVDASGNIVHQHSPSALYIYDALGQEVGLKGANEDISARGALLKKLAVTTGGKGLSSPTPVDIDRDGVVDVVYAGDYSGDLYRFDLRGGIANWKVTRIFKGDPSQPIVAAPSVKPHNKSNQEYVVLFGTGSDIYDDDLQKNSKQSFFGIYDDLNKDVVETTSTGSTANAFSNGSTDVDKLLKVAERADLRIQAMKFISKPNGEKIREIVEKTDEQKNEDKTKEKANSFRGWVIDLVDSNTSNNKTGERVVTKANVLGETVFFTTRSYLSEAEKRAKVCTSSTSSGFSWLMGVDAEKGGRLTRKHTRFVNKSGAPVFYSGIKFSGILSPMVSSFSNKVDTQSLEEYGPEALNENNEVRSTGYDNPLGKKENKLPRRLICGVQEGANALFFTASDIGFGKMGIQAADCPDPRRISWRELF